MYFIIDIVGDLFMSFVLVQETDYTRTGYGVVSTASLLST